jgi:hypothetical protein
MAAAILNLTYLARLKPERAANKTKKTPARPYTIGET